MYRPGSSLRFVLRRTSGPNQMPYSGASTVSSWPLSLPRNARHWGTSLLPDRARSWLSSQLKREITLTKRLDEIAARLDRQEAPRAAGLRVA